MIQKIRKEWEGKPDNITKQHNEVLIQAEHFRGSSEMMRDYVFDQYMKQQLVEDFFEDLTDYFTRTEVDLMKSLLAEYNDEDIYSALSLPKELRTRKFEQFESEVEAGSSIEQTLQNFVEQSKKYKFSIGYHTSPYDIRPDDASNGRWVIKGTEKDHRDNDRMMAYYSTHYRHLFKKKDPKFIYVVRVDPSSHLTDGNWSRADSLSVIMRVPYNDVVQYVESTVKKNATPVDSTEVA